MPLASFTLSAGCAVLYLPQILRTSAQRRLYFFRNLQAVSTSSSISSVVTPSLILSSGRARSRSRLKPSAETARNSRRVEENIFRLYLYAQPGNVNQG